jgi:hypothetical protein
MRHSDDESLTPLRKRYAHVHPLIFLRSSERAKDLHELFEILEGIPKMPVVWDESVRSWVREPDVMAKKHVGRIIGK